MMNIYIDLDGVLFTGAEQVANHADEFLRAILEKYPDSTYRLAARSQRDENKAKEILVSHLKPETVALLDRIKISEWKDLKTDAIDFEQDFLWFDNELWPSELNVLEKHEVAEQFIMVNFGKDPGILQKLAQVVNGS